MLKEPLREYLGGFFWEGPPLLSVEELLLQCDDIIADVLSKLALDELELLLDAEELEVGLLVADGSKEGLFVEEMSEPAAELFADLIEFLEFFVVLLLEVLDLVHELLGLQG